ncbi:MAG: hypothetical protein BroJett011_69970 [Chloroflexota bacterium]|nr:MAG: hypothetical protein BroJett011_69970 [Chloroflexota bacterium]
MAIIEAIGAPENESERKAIAYLKEYLPDSYIVFHNLELPTPSGLPYEYDLIVVGEYAVYTWEVKGYRGLIKGNASEWELESGAIYRSPLPLANKKAKIVADRLLRHNLRLEKVWVQPLIVLTDDRAQIRLNDDQANRVLHLAEAVAYMSDPQHLPIRPEPITSLIRLIREAIAHQFRPLHRPHEIGEYHLLDTIGKNDLYTTIVAEHRLISNSRFTLKVYNFNLYASPEERRKQAEWTRRDVSALYRLAGHPNIVRANPPFPWQDNQLVVPLEWVDGYSLRGLLDSGMALDFARKIEIIRQAGTGLAYAHSQGVIHRDVRPDNIIVPYRGPVKLINFDCARLEGSDLQTIATRVGRRLDQRYVAPEVWQAPAAVSPAADQYGLGAVLFELLTGQPPYQRIRELFAAGGLPHRPTAVNPALLSEVDEVIARMCAFNPAARYGRLEEALEDLAIIG